MCRDLCVSHEKRTAQKHNSAERYTGLFLLFQRVLFVCVCMGARVGGSYAFNGHFASHILVWFRKRHPHDNWTALPCVERVVSGSGPKQRRHETRGSGLPPSHQQHFQYNSCYQLNEMGLVAVFFVLYVVVVFVPVLPTSTCVCRRVVAEVSFCCFRLYIEERTSQRGDGTPDRHSAGLGRL